MVHLIDKDALVAEIEKRKHMCDFYHGEYWDGCYNTMEDLILFLNTLEVKEVDTWHLQEKENIYDAVKGWGLYTFVCIMKDGTIQRFNGCLDEDYEGRVHVHINGVNDDYDNVDDIVKWIELA